MAEKTEGNWDGPGGEGGGFGGGGGFDPRGGGGLDRDPGTGHTPVQVRAG